VSGFVDMHTHLVPGIDDGPDDLEGALDMARAAARAGTATIAATPHLRSDFPDVHAHELAERCQTLRDAIGREVIAVRVICGAEVSLVWALEASEEQLALATYDQRGTDLLIETPTDVTAIEELLYQLRSRGMRVTLAHPERSHAFQRDPRLLESLYEQGVLLQVNAGPLVARRKSPVRSLAQHLCRKGLAHAIASDGHRASSWRPVTLLSAGVEAAATLVGHARAQWMASDAPRAIIAGESLPAAPELEGDRRRWWGAG
jgi:protein-tyrosine phosphatase